MSEFIKAGVIGHPIEHSKSPLIHNYWIKKYGLNGEYRALDVPPGHLRDQMNELIAEGYTGFNITVPHKERIMLHCDEIEETARKIGAVNTVVVEKTSDGHKKIGRNTDAYGFIENIKSAHPEFDFAAGPALVIGAGGAARAVVYGLLEEGVPEIRILNRTLERAEKIAEDMADDRVRAFEWNPKENPKSLIEDTNLLVNTTVLGMEGQPPLTLDIERLPTSALVCDIVYAPLKTELLKIAEDRGNRIVGGLGMLLNQARPAFEAWFGLRPELDETLQKLVI